MIYGYILLGILFLSSRGYEPNTPLTEYIRFSSNIIPFKTISTYISALFTGSMNLNIPIENLVGNFILFIPMGIYLPYFIKKLNKLSIYVTVMTLLLFGIEVVQLVTRRGSFDIDDFILNMLGALLGYFIWKSKVVQNLLK